MKHVSEALKNLLKNLDAIPLYRPPYWESPIEKKLWQTLRYIGISVETQAQIGNFRVDMVLSSRSNSNKVMVECDGVEFHHPIIDDFRDDELLAISSLPIAHIAGKEITKSAERCTLYIVENWFPELMNTMGYLTTLEKEYGDTPEIHVNGCSGFFPVGYVRTPDYKIDDSYSDTKIRRFVRFITGENDSIEFESEADRILIESLKSELNQNDLMKRKLSPTELARAYILISYEESDRILELNKLDRFLDNLVKKNLKRNGS